MDTRDQALKKTRLHDESHPTPHRPASLRRNYSLPMGSIMELAMEKGWWWQRSKIPSSEPQTDSRSRLSMKNRRWWWLRLVKRDNSFSLIFFSGNMGFYCIGLRVNMATRWAAPTWAHLGVGAPWWVVPTQVPPSGISWLQKFSLLI